jgi:hypothetical protein
MRKLMIVPLAGALLLGAAAPVAAGPNTSSSSGSGRTIQGEWYRENGYGAVYLFEETGGAYGELLVEDGEWVQCDPNDEDSFGFQGTRIQGWTEDVTLSLDTRLTSGSATADFDLAIETVDDCVGTYDVTDDSASVSIDVTGAGPLASVRDHSSFKIPGSYNAHSFYKGKQRDAVGSIDMGSLGSADFGWAVMVEYSYRDHANG